MLISTDTDTSLRVLDDPLRRRIVELLAPEALCTCHLMDETGAAQTTVSHHLRILREAGWVDVEPMGRFTYYRLRPGPVLGLSRELAGLAEKAVHPGRRRPC